MATETMTLTERQRKPKDLNLPPENERYLRACSDIASALVQEHEALQDPTKPKKDINLNSLRAKMSKKHKLNNIPPLTAIIAAIPEHYKKYILPKLIAKPISTSPFAPHHLPSNITQEAHQVLRWLL
jgi:elongator complex protein 3